MKLDLKKIYLMPLICLKALCLLFSFFILSKRKRRSFRAKIFSLMPSYSVPYTPPTSTYKYLVNLEGFGYSGKTALLDFLREFENCTVIYHDKEIGLLRRFGGLYYLEQAFRTKNLNIRDFMLKTFITFTECLYLRGGLYTDEYKRLTNLFVKNLLLSKQETTNGLEGNECFKFYKQNIKDYPNLQTPFLFENVKKRYVYYLKDISVSEYREIAKKYILSFLKTIPSQDFLILDAILSDGSYDMHQKNNYVGEFKNIIIYRDPRDTYAQIYNGKVENIPKEINDFINWYTYQVKGVLESKQDGCVAIRYEDLIFNYNKVTVDVLGFIGIEKTAHINPKKYFDPEVSAKYVGLWKSFANQEDMKKIYTALRKYCYDPVN